MSPMTLKITRLVEWQQKTVTLDFFCVSEKSRIQMCKVEDKFIL